MILVVGLGNPTFRYSKTRHNVGFWVIDKLIEKVQTQTINKPQFQGELYKSSEFLFLKPQTYMNNSGVSVRAVASYFKIESIVVIHDDLDLPVGSLRFKTSGGHGGHNGLKSIDAHCGSEYFRVRIGIDKPSFKDDVVKHVLEPFRQDELEVVLEVVDRATDAVLALTKMTKAEIGSTFTLKKKKDD
ncbi:MAG: aminoacyl-tRNA hydrolase [Campylobacteraceae bacterium]|nr:aminoacyl-tRNA hydrolase [Campylobacteraceae bacterium]